MHIYTILLINSKCIRNPQDPVSLLQLGVFGLGGDEDGDGGVSVFPEREEILIGGAGFGGISLQGIRPASEVATRRPPAL